MRGVILVVGLAISIWAKDFRRSDGAIVMGHGFGILAIAPSWATSPVFTRWKVAARHMEDVLANLMSRRMGGLWHS
ncbi:MAG: hypothetical protein AAF367_04300 [Pseudomonadota bacterium]